MESFKEKFTEFKESTAGKAVLGVSLGLLAAVLLFCVLGMKKGLRAEDSEAAADLKSREASELIAAQSEHVKRNLSGGVVMDIDWDTIEGYDKDGNPVYATQRTVPTVGGYDMCGAPLGAEILITTGKTADTGENVYGGYSAIDAARERGISSGENPDIDWNKTAGYDKDNNPLFVSKSGESLCYDLLMNALKQGTVIAIHRTDSGLPIYDYSTIQTAKAAGKNAQKAQGSAEFKDASDEMVDGPIVRDDDMGVRVHEVTDNTTPVSINKVDALPGEEGAPKSVSSSTVGEKTNKGNESGNTGNGTGTASSKNASNTGTTSTGSTGSGSTVNSSSSVRGTGSGGTTTASGSGSSSGGTSSSDSGTSYGSLSSVDNSPSSGSSGSSSESKVKYTVTFDPDNGKKVNKVDVENGETVTKPSDPTKDGYGFDGWYLDNEKFSFSTKIKKNITLTAHWTRNSYKVIFDWNKPEAMIAAQGKYSYFTFPSTETFNAEYGKTYGECNDDFPEINATTDVYGYYFQGWYTGSTKITSETDVLEKAVTLTASWRPITYKITYQKGTDEKKSAIKGDMSMTSYVSTYIVEDTLNIPDPSIEGYEFLGWTYDKVTNPVKELSFTRGTVGDKTLVAHWKGNSITVIYDANGGSGTMRNQSFTYSSSAALSLCDYVFSGHTFIGWNTQKNGSGTLYTSDNGVILADSTLFKNDGATVTLYAQWKTVSYYVAFAGNNATSGDMAIQTFTYGTQQALNASTYTKTGYLFNGWSLSSTDQTVKYKDQAQVSNLTDKDGETVTLYAVWSPVTYNVAFYANNEGATTSPKTQQMTYDEVYSLMGFSSTSFTYKGHVFRGWGTDPDQYYPDFSDCATVSNLCTENKDTFTLYALWSTGIYDLKFNPGKDGSVTGSVSPSSKKVEFGKPYGALPEPRMDGHSFKGWYSKSGSSVSDEYLVDETTLMEEEGATIYAQWIKN